MGALDDLRREHQVILAVAQRMANAVAEPLDRETAAPFIASALEFIRVYADENHHGKEERALFPVMRENEALAGLAEALEEEHGDGRRFVKAIHDALKGDAADLRGSVLDYVHFIRDHIAKEDEMIFEAAESGLTAADADRLARDFAAIEAEVLGSDGLDKLLARLYSSSHLAVT